MKKVLYYVFVTFMVWAIASCTKSNPSEPDAKTEKKTFSAILDNTKTYVAGDGTKLYWENGDNIAIFDNKSEDAHKFTISNINGNNAVFKGEVTAGATQFYAVYPYSAAVSRSGENLTATLPEEQRIGSFNASQGAFLAVGLVEDGIISFKNVFGLIKVEVTYSDITEIVISGNNIAGTAVFNATDGALKSIAEGKGTTRLLPPAGEDVFPTGTYYLSLLPGTTPANAFSVTMKRPIEGSMIAYSASETATEAVTVRPKNVINYSDHDTRLEWAIHLSSKQDLLAWNNIYEKWQADDKVVLDCDIEMNNNPLSEAWTAHDFAGIFDGQGHAIRKIHISNDGDANFFGVVSGTIKNLTFGAEGDGSYFYGTAASGQKYIAPIRSTTETGRLESLTNYATVDLQGNSGYYVAGICGTSSASQSMSNCKNYGAVKVTGNPTTIINLAGIVASTQTNLTGCENHGPISFESTSYSNNINFGGIAGYATTAITFDDCLNSGSLTITRKLTSAGGTSFRFGGILSYNSGEGVIMRNCTNKGNMLCDATSFSTKTLYVGGMIGQQQSSSNNGIRLTQCANEGDITLKTLSNGGNVYMGGMIGYRNNGGTASEGIIGGADGGCVNLGVLSDYTTKTANNKQNVYMGGMVGWNDMPLTLTNCINGESGSAVKGTICEKGQEISPNFTALAGIVGWQTTTADASDTRLIIDKCYNYASISNQSGCPTQYVYLAGIVAGNEAKSSTEGEGGTQSWTFFDTSITNTHNLGSISNSCDATSQIRLGGFVGDSANNISISGGSTNTGRISSVSEITNPGGLHLRLAGFVGSVSRGSTHSFSNCSNSGDIYAENTSAEELAINYLGGISGYISSGLSATFDSCQSSSNISFVGNVTESKAAAITAVSNSVIGQGISHCGISGSILGTAITSSNYKGFFYCGDETKIDDTNYCL